MTYLDLISLKHLTNYKISKLYGLPLTTLQDIASGKSSLLNCNGKTLLTLSKALNVTIEDLLSLEPEDSKTDLPVFLKKSIDSFRKALRTNSTLLDCYFDELCSSINIAEIEQYITHEIANKIRRRYFTND